MINSIAIFEADMTSIPSILIAFITNAPWTHAAIKVDGVWYDASETRGHFDKLDTNKFKNRWCIIVEFEGDLKSWITEMIGKKYNWKGVYQYPFPFLKRKSKNKFYCFQAAWDAVWFSLYKEHFTPTNVSASTLKYLMLELADYNLADSEHDRMQKNNMNKKPFVYQKGLN